MLEKEGTNSIMSHVGCAVEWRGEALAGLGVHISSVFHQKLAHVQLATTSGIVERSVASRIAVVRECRALGQQCTALGQVTVHRGAPQASLPLHLVKRLDRWWVVWVG